MSTLKALAAVALWQTAKFDTCEIAVALEVEEHEVCCVLHFARKESRRRA